MEPINRQNAGLQAALIWRKSIKDVVSRILKVGTDRVRSDVALTRMNPHENRAGWELHDAPRMRERHEHIQDPVTRGLAERNPSHFLDRTPGEDTPGRLDDHPLI